MTAIDITIITIGSLVLLFSAWALWCNRQTYRDRQQMLDECLPGRDDFWPKIRRLQSVSYDQHLRARLLMQDPHKLYLDA